MQNKENQKREKILKKIQEFCLLDDDFMTKCFEDNIECTELVLRIIMDKADLKVTEARTQYTIKSLQGRSVRLDIDAVDSTGQEYDIEILFEDGSHILYVNGAYKDNSPLGLLMQDFACKNPENMHYKILADRVRYFKEDEKGVRAMCKAVEELCREEKHEAMMDAAKRLLEDGTLTVEKIAECVGLTVEEVKELTEQK